MKKTETKVELPFTEPEFLEKWTEWIMYRKQRHLSNYTPIGVEKTFKGLMRDCNGDLHTALQMIDQSIEKSWQGIFALKNNFAPQKNNNGASYIRNTVQKPVAKIVPEGSFGKL